MLSLQIVRSRVLPLLRSTAASRGAHGHSHDGQACGHSHGPPEEGDGAHGHSHSHAPPELDQQTGLPLEQRAKNILVGNWRGQLTTIVAGKRDGWVFSSCKYYIVFATVTHKICTYIILK